MRACVRLPRAAHRHQPPRTPPEGSGSNCLRKSSPIDNLPVQDHVGPVKASKPGTSYRHNFIYGNSALIYL